MQPPPGYPPGYPPPGYPPPPGVPPNAPPPGPAQGFQPFTPPPVGYYQPVRPAPQTSGEAVGALVCGLMAWFCFPLGFVAIYLGVRARRLVRENPETVGGDGLALAGMIVGGVLGTLQLVIWILYFGFFAAMIGIGAASGP